MKRIGILGSGVVGKTLAQGFVDKGYEVQLASRDPAKLEDWKNDVGNSIELTSFEDTAAFGDILILAVQGRSALAALDLCGPINLENKTIIDATNPISDEAPENGMVNFFTNNDQSLMELLQHVHPKANFVKAFNSIGSAHMVDPIFELKPTMFICGDNENAKKETSVILDQFGWEVEDMGSSRSARVIEPLCILWCIPGFLGNQWNHAFKLLK